MFQFSFMAISLSMSNAGVNAERHKQIIPFLSGSFQIVLDRYVTRQVSDTKQGKN